MSWALTHLPSETKTVIDPFMGSGTTGVACVRARLSFVGIERETKYFDAACRRIAAEVAAPRLFAEPAPKPVQEALDL
jgi:site-specific DNA-methyltransferase (adenine-specific)/modification methylase